MKLSLRKCPSCLHAMHSKPQHASPCTHEPLYNMHNSHNMHHCTICQTICSPSTPRSDRRVALNGSQPHAGALGYRCVIGAPHPGAHSEVSIRYAHELNLMHAGVLLLEHPREQSLRVAVRGHVDGHEERDDQPVHRQGRCAALDQHHADVHFGDVRRLVLGRLGNGPNARIA